MTENLSVRCACGTVALVRLYPGDPCGKALVTCSTCGTRLSFVVPRIPSEQAPADVPRLYPDAPSASKRDERFLRFEERLAALTPREDK